MTTAALTGWIPGTVPFTYPARERRTQTYRTWLGQMDMGWCAECLLCGEWTSSGRTRADAERWAARKHPAWCHVVNGCHCYWPHITAAMGARLGLGTDYPRHLAGVPFRMAGGVRKHCPPSIDLQGTVHEYTQIGVRA